MKSFLRFIVAVLIAALVTTVLASILSTQKVVSALEGVSAVISFPARLAMTGYDLMHFAPLYGVFVFIGLLIACLAGRLVYHFARTARVLIFVCAGFVAMIVMLALMERVFFGVPLVAGARDLSGLGLQALAGALGGFIFHLMTQSRNRAAA